MKDFPHVTRTRLLAPAFFAVLLLALPAAHADEDDLAAILKSAKPTTAPSADLDPQSQPAPTDPLGTMKPHAPAEARIGTLTLNTGKKIEGRVWTTLQTPLRVFLAGEQAYRDVDFATISKLEVLIDSAQLEPDWRWKKEGSDEKVFSGKKYPNIEARYKFTLVNGQTVDGGVVAPIYIEDGNGRQIFVLDKKYKGPLDAQLTDLTYIKSLELRLAEHTAAANAQKTRKLPLLPD